MPNDTRGSRPPPTVAPRADEKVLDLEKEFGNMTIRPGKTVIDGAKTSSSHAEYSRPSTSCRHHSSSSSKATEKTTMTASQNSNLPINVKHNEQIMSAKDGRSRDPTMRIPTTNYALGNMARTYIEGMQQGSQYEQQNASQKSYPKSSQFKSIAPPTAQTVVRDEKDMRMVSRQSQYASLSPREQDEQNRWAKSVIGRFAPCPEGFEFERRQDGYQCKGGHHLITDDLLAENRGGIWCLPDENNTQQRWGPYYAESSNPKLFFYSGPEPLDGGFEVLGRDNGLCRHETLRLYHDYRARLKQLKPELFSQQGLQIVQRPGNVQNMSSSGCPRHSLSGHQNLPPGGRGFGSQGWGQNPEYGN